jgi:hypothetical protein
MLVTNLSCIAFVLQTYLLLNQRLYPWTNNTDPMCPKVESAGQNNSKLLSFLIADDFISFAPILFDPYIVTVLLTSPVSL